jgi:uncharacterized protein (TIGR00304 family)
MNRYMILSILCFIAGGSFLGIAVSQGEAAVYWLLIIPVFQGTGPYSFAGTLLIIAGIITFMVGLASGSFQFVSLDEFYAEFDEPYPTKHARDTGSKAGGAKRNNSRQPEFSTAGGPAVDRSYGCETRPATKPRSTIKTGGVVFIGPIPIIWGSDKKIAYIMALVSVVLVVIFLIYVFYMMANL